MMRSYHILVAVLLAFGLLCQAVTFGPPPRQADVPAFLRDKLDSASSAGPTPNLSEALRRSPAEAREMARVKGGLFEGDEINSYSGYLSVDPATDSNLFFWYFEPENGDADAPVILWLQGGPGGSSLFGLFAENGPYYLTEDLEVVPRNITWASTFHLIYIDNPVGTGFSYSNYPAGVCTNETCVASGLFNGLVQFFTMFESLQDNDFYVSGESYAGKYVPSLSYYILKNGAGAPFTFKGFTCGDCLIDPIHQASVFADNGFAMGVADELDYSHMVKMYGELVSNIENEQWLAASNTLGFDAFTYYANISGSDDPYDVRQSVQPVYSGNIAAYVNQSSIRQLLNVGDHYYQTGEIAAAGLSADIAKSVAYTLPELFAAYKVCLYNGQWDWIVGPAGTETMLQNLLDWPELPVYLTTRKTLWSINDHQHQIAGYVRQVGSLTQVVLRNAGHIAPYNQPAAMFDLITRFTGDMSFANGTYTDTLYTYDTY